MPSSNFNRNTFRLTNSIGKTLRSSFSRNKLSSSDLASFEFDIISSPQGDAISNETQGFCEMVENGDWNLVASEISTTKLKKLNESIRASDKCKGGSVLHFVLRYNPPLSIITSIVQNFPESIFQKDDKHRTALHISIEYNASKYIIGHLVKINSHACSIQDKEGKNPLHKCFDNDCAEDKIKKCVPNHVIELLVESSPSSVEQEDEDGMCALELAIISEAPLEVVKFLQRVKRTHRRVESEKHSKSMTTSINLSGISLEDSVNSDICLRRNSTRACAA